MSGCIPQVGGYWTRRAELPLFADIQAKVGPAAVRLFMQAARPPRAVCACPPAKSSLPGTTARPDSGGAGILLHGGVHKMKGYGTAHPQVVICNPEGQPVLWEPGTTNRVLAAPRDVAGAPATAMHVFVCRWSTPAHTPVVSVPVEHEDPSKEYVKQLDAAQREIGLMRQVGPAG